MWYKMMENKNIHKNKLFFCAIFYKTPENPVFMRVSRFL